MLPKERTGIIQVSQDAQTIGKIHENNLHYNTIFCLLEVPISLYMAMLGTLGIGIHFVASSLEPPFSAIGSNDVIKARYMLDIAPFP